MGVLYLVATPIGNREDITARALRILREVPLIAAEDTRHTRSLLKHFGISTPLVSYHEHNERARRDDLLDALAAGDVALVSDAGTPALSDPGYDLVRAAVAAGHPVTPVPGPTAAIAALTASGLVPGAFLMFGFLPRRGQERQTALARAAMAGVPVVVFEAPPRLAATLIDLAEALGDREAAVARELTKLHEEIVRGRLRELADRFQTPPRGEVVIVVGEPIETRTADVEAEEVLQRLVESGLSPSRAAREAAAMTGRPRSELYSIIQERQRETASGGARRRG